MAETQVSVTRIITTAKGFRQTVRLGGMPEKILCRSVAAGQPCHAYWREWPPANLSRDPLLEKETLSCPGIITEKQLAVLRSPQGRMRQYIGSVTPVLIDFTDYQVTYTDIQRGSVHSAWVSNPNPSETFLSAVLIGTYGLTEKTVLLVVYDNMKSAQGPVVTTSLNK